MRRRLGICIALLLALPTTAGAQDGGEVLVASSGKTEVHAEQRPDGELCFTIRSPRAGGGGCGDRPTLREPMSTGVDGAAGGAVVPQVARVEVEWPDGARVSAATAEHPSFPGMRWFAAEHGTREPWLLRFFDAEGRLLAADEEGRGPVVGRPVTLGSGGAGRALGVRWTLRAYLRRAHSPVPGELDRTEPIACLERRVGGSGAWRCNHAEPQLNEILAGDVFGTGTSEHGRAGPHRLVFGALLSPGVASVDVELGDGRRVRARVREFGGEGTTARVASYVVPVRAAVRRLVVRDSGGRVLDRQAIALAPGHLGGDGHGSIFLGRPPLPGAGEVAAGPVADGEGVLRVREIGAQLCAEVEGMYPPDVPCGPFPQTPQGSLLASGGTEHHGVVGGVVPPEVASVELHERGLGDGPEMPVVRVATQAPAPYAGAFAAHVRTFVALLEHGGFVRVRMLDASGAELLETTIDAFRWVDGPPPRRTRTRLRAGRVRLRSMRDDSTCVTLTDRGARLDHLTCAMGSEDEVEVHVACRPAASVVILPAKRGVVLRTASGRLLRPLRLRLARQPHAVFVVPAPDAPRALTWRGGRMALGRIPAPRAQCGYKLERAILGRARG